MKDPLKILDRIIIGQTVTQELREAILAAIVVAYRQGEVDALTEAVHRLNAQEGKEG